MNRREAMKAIAGGLLGSRAASSVLTILDPSSKVARLDQLEWCEIHCQNVDDYIDFVRQQMEFIARAMMIPAELVEGSNSNWHGQ